MHRESETLRTLSIPGIAHWIDSNTDSFEDAAIDLYLITEFIQGKIASDLTTPLEFDHAIQAVVKLLETLEVCHDRGIVHRDVKPNNVVIQESSGTPILIDFGISFNDADLGAVLSTGTGQRVGNQWFQLPEHQPDSTLKRDSRSDVTMAIGLLFYFLSGNRPGALVDHANRKPHERDSKLHLPEDGPARVHLNRVFNRAFQSSLDERYSSAREAVADLQLFQDAPRLAEVYSDPERIIKDWIEIREATQPRKRLSVLRQLQVDWANSLSRAAAWMTSASSSRISVSIQPFQQSTRTVDEWKGLLHITDIGSGTTTFHVQLRVDESDDVQCEYSESGDRWVQAGRFRLVAEAMTDDLGRMASRLVTQLGEVGISGTTEES